MNKQEAIDYIHLRLEQDATCEEIVRVLVEQLHAPEAMVSRFVAQTETEYQKNKRQALAEPVSTQPVKLPPWLEEMTIGAQPVGSQPVENTSQPVKPQPDWMQRLAQGVNIPQAVAPAAAAEPLPDWAQAPSQAESYYAAPTPAPASLSWEAEAKEFVVTQLQYGRLHSDITDELADRLGIPLSRAQSVVTGIAAQVESKPPQKITSTAEAAEFVKTEFARGRPKLEIAAELASRTGEPRDLTEKFVNLTIAKLDKSSVQDKPVAIAEKTLASLNNPELEKYVISELAKNRKRSDIVMAICERTGAHWSEAQRFVGQVSAQKHTTIHARKNRLIIPLCIGAIVMGFIFTLGTAYPMVYLVSGRTSEFYEKVNMAGSLGDYFNAAPYIFGTGIVLIAGGIIGLVTAMQSQME
jgi:hypothetical protein